MLRKKPAEPTCSRDEGVKLPLPGGRGRTKHARSQAALTTVAFGTAVMLMPPSAMANPEEKGAGQAATGDQETTGASTTATNNGSDITRPQTAFELRASDQGNSNETSKTNTAQTLLRLSSNIPLGTGWRMGLLAQVPFKEETTTTFDPSGVSHDFGLGDATFQAFVAHDLNERWAIGAGARLVARTASDDLGTGKWQIMPGFGVRYSLPEWGEDSYFVPVIRYAISFAGDPQARRISEPQIAPTLNIDLPGPWFLTFYPSNDIRINFGQPKSGQSGRLFLPFDALIGVKLTNTLQISLEGGVPIVKEYPVYNFKTELRLRLLF
ncbi:MAG TPA: transporter [Methylocella sp.]|nr:transporter [Methylocella sp.]